MVEETKERVIRWFDYVDKLWPALAGVVCLTFFFGNRLETPEAKARRISAAIAPLTKENERLREEVRSLEAKLEGHTALGGHAVMDSRMNHVEQRLNEVWLKVHQRKGHIE